MPVTTRGRFRHRAGGRSGTADSGATKAVFRTGPDVDELIPALRCFLENAPGNKGKA
jgi:hypothetical protein